MNFDFKNILSNLSHDVQKLAMQVPLLASARVTWQKLVRTPPRSLSQGIEKNLNFSKESSKTINLYVIAEK